MCNNIDFVFFTGTNCVDFPFGGITSFTRQMMKAFGNRMALVGLTTDDTPVGRWIKKDFEGISYMFFSIGKLNRGKIKPFIPIRLRTFYQLRKYRNEILSLKIENAFVQNSHILLAIKDWPIKNKAYIFHGVTNPLKKTRYPFMRLFAAFYERRMFNRLKTYNSVFAAADNRDIKKMIVRSRLKLKRKDIIKMPTRFDNRIFYPNGKEHSICKLGLKRDKLILVQVGRLSKQKGCSFILDSFNCFIRSNPDSMLYFVGDGEERENIQKKINSLGLSRNVVITGYVPKEQVALFFNAADLVLVGSFMEGWSVAMVEALACGRTIVSTNVSGADEMVVPEKNGYIVYGRDPELFAKRMIEALKIPSPNNYSIDLSSKYSLVSLKKNIEDNWMFS